MEMEDDFIIEALRTFVREIARLNLKPVVGLDSEVDFDVFSCGELARLIDKKAVQLTAYMLGHRNGNPNDDKAMFIVIPSIRRIKDMLDLATLKNLLLSARQHEKNMAVYRQALENQVKKLLEGTQ